jgi:hypothetical protein
MTVEKNTSEKYTKGIADRRNHKTEGARIVEALKQISTLYRGVRRGFVLKRDIERDYAHLFTTEDGSLEVKSLEDLIEPNKINDIQDIYLINLESMVETNGSDKPHEVANRANFFPK